MLWDHSRCNEFRSTFFLSIFVCPLHMWQFDPWMHLSLHPDWPIWIIIDSFHVVRHPWKISIAIAYNPPWHSKTKEICSKTKLQEYARRSQSWRRFFRAKMLLPGEMSLFTFLTLGIVPCTAVNLSMNMEMWCADIFKVVHWFFSEVSNSFLYQL